MSLLLHVLVQLPHVIARTKVDAGGLPTASADTATLRIILNVASSIIGGLALVMITVSGLRYIVANGDPQKISKAKNGIIYSLVGLIIAISAQAIVAYVVNGL